MNIEGFATRIVADTKTGCWLWMGSRNRKGYAVWQTSHGPQTTRIVSRLAWQTWRGQLIEGLTIDHLCRVRHCVNPAHLDQVTRGENVKRGDTIIAANLRKTHCPKGHPFDALNTISDKPGWRECRICKYARTRKRNWLARIDGGEA